MVYEVSTNPRDPECRRCCTHKICGTNVVECMENKDCDWLMRFGHGRFCMSPSVLQKTNSERLWLSI